MTDKIIPFGDRPSDTAVLLLAASEELGLGSGAVKTTEGAFLVPEEVADRAGLGEPKPPVKKAATKRAAKKHTTEKGD